MLDYTIITKLRVFDENRYPEDETYSLKLLEEQEEKCNILGLKDDGVTTYLCHFFDSAWFDERTEPETLYDAIQMLAVKDGVDLVQFSNGNYGFVAYYNGGENGFEIIG